MYLSSTNGNANISITKLTLTGNGGGIGKDLNVFATALHLLITCKFSFIKDDYQESMYSLSGSDSANLSFDLSLFSFFSSYVNPFLSLDSVGGEDNEYCGRDTFKCQTLEYYLGKSCDSTVSYTLSLMD
jgi:hypothetical protein